MLTAPPATPPKSSAPASPAAPSSLPLTKHTLLVVDDEEGPRHSLRMVFRNDFHVHTVESGDKAVEFARQNPVHVAILDIRMAGQNGIEVLRALKAVDAHIEVIMLTAYETLDTARQAIRLGACDYLSKPFDLTTIRDAAHRALRMRMISENISTSTDRLKALTDQLQDAALREEMYRTTNQIYAGVIHDINNPLTIISGYTELLVRRIGNARTVEGNELQTLRQDINMISKQVNTCCAIASRYMKFLARRHDRDSRQASANQILSDLRDLLANHPAARRCQLTVDTLEQDAVAGLDPTELTQILLNLATNAMQCSAAPQHVRIVPKLLHTPLDLQRMASGPSDAVIGKEEFHNQAPLLAISVIDQGPGIPPDILPRIFTPFFTTKAPDKGTGLGLSIVARLIKTARGLVHVETHLGAGTRFTLYLPADC